MGSRTSGRRAPRPSRPGGTPTRAASPSAVDGLQPHAVELGLVVGANAVDDIVAEPAGREPLDGLLDVDAEAVDGDEHREPEKLDDRVDVALRDVRGHLRGEDRREALE